MTPPDMPSFLDERGHVPATEMARYIDGTSDRVARSRLTHHLADCDECREELTALRRLVPHRFRLTTRVGAMLGAAAAVMLITMSWTGTLTPWSDEASPDSTRAQRGVPEIDAPFAVVFPATDALVSADSVRLAWRVAGADASYYVVVQDESGGIVFSKTTSDTSTIVPPDAFPKRRASGTTTPAHTYYWSVAARLFDGRSANSGFHHFRVP